MSAAAVQPPPARQLRVPPELLDLQQWVLWRYDHVDGKPRKVPYQTSGKPAKSNDPLTWAEYGEVIDALPKLRDAQGIGFVFSEADPYTGVDLDDCLDDARRLKEWALPILQRFVGTYAEVSPSGSGIKLWCRGAVPSGTQFRLGDGQVEMYSRARYFCVTGDIWPGAFLEIANCQESLDWLLTLNPAGAKKAPFVLPREIKHPEQHFTLRSLAGKLRRSGFEEAELAEALIIASKRCEEVPPESHMRDMAASFCRLYPAGPTTEFNRQVARAVEWATNRDEEHPDNEGCGDWKELLLRGKPNKKTGEPGGVKSCNYNADIALRKAPEWAGALQFDEFSQRVRLVRDTPIGGTVPRDLSDADIMNISIWMQGEGLFVGQEMVGSVADAVAMAHTVHPLRDWLNGLEWDGVPRVGSWLSVYMGAAGGSYTSNAGRWWMISAVARVMRPGCQADHMLIMEGPQGRGKSTALRILAGDEYFTDQLPDLHSKDASLQLFGKWMIEWGELDTLARSQVESVKTFVSRRVETLRRPYGKMPVDVPRQCVFGGSTNDSEYLRDVTGNRRFWPFLVGSIDLKALARDREQLWAEAVALYRDGVNWWPESEEWIKQAAVEASLRVEGDVWGDRIKEITTGRDEVTPTEVLTALGIPLKDMKQADRNRVGRCLRLIGFEPTRSRDQGRFFVRKDI